ncbi:MAG: dihydrodipicolinate reductase, partial [Methanobacteriota archaeon]
LEFIAAVGQPDPGETIEIKGEPNLTSKIPSGVNGDVATCAIAVNAISSIVRAAPGLHVMTDLPTISCFDID